MALVGEGSFTTLEPSSHTRTNMDVIGLFLPVRFEMDRRNKDLWRIEIRAAWAPEISHSEPQRMGVLIGRHTVKPKRDNGRA